MPANFSSSVASVSHFDVEGDSMISAGPVSSAPSPFRPHDGNVFPKFASQLTDKAWELWYFDGTSKDGKTAFSISFFRDASALKNGGWRVQVFALWPDGTTWNKELYYAESIVTAEHTPGGLESECHGRVRGIWRARDHQSSASFTVAPDLSAATLNFKGQDVVGTVILKASSGNRQGLPSSESAALLCPAMYYIRPISLAEAEADLNFHTNHDTTAGSGNNTAPPNPEDVSTTSSRKFHFVAGRGGMDRCWTTKSWPQLLSESLFLRASLGPYRLQVMRINSPPGSGSTPYTTARLWRDQELVCAPQQVVHASATGEGFGGDSTDHAQDAIYIAKMYAGDRDKPGATGAFRDKNVGYVIQFVKGIGLGQGKGNPPRNLLARNSSTTTSRWRFEARHIQVWWNMPTSPPGHNATGNSAFLETVCGGASGEVWPPGTGVIGQLQLLDASSGSLGSAVEM